MDRIVLDIETKNSFEDVGGRDHLKDLSVSVVGVYSYDEDKYIAFDEHEMEKLGELLKRTQLIVTFAGARFDLPVLEKYFSFNFNSIEHFDILEEVERTSAGASAWEFWPRRTSASANPATGLRPSKCISGAKSRSLRIIVCRT